MADDFIEHEETPGLAPTKDGVLAFFPMQLRGVPGHAHARRRMSSRR